MDKSKSKATMEENESKCLHRPNRFFSLFSLLLQLVYRNCCSCLCWNVTVAIEITWCGNERNFQAISRGWMEHTE